MFFEGLADIFGYTLFFCAVLAVEQMHLGPAKLLWEPSFSN